MIRISVPTIRTSKRKPISGFTLIELLVVISLIALIMSIAVPNVNLALKANIKNGSRKLATAIREAYDEAILKGLTHRLVIDMDHDAYWMEVGPPTHLLLTEEQAEERQRKLRHLNKEELEKEAHKTPFSLAEGLNKRKLELPKGVHFHEIITPRSKDPIKGGVVYGHIFPHGYIEKLIIYLQDDYKREATIIINPVTGKSRVFDHYVEEAKK